MIRSEIDTLFFTLLLKISGSEFLIQDFISRLTVNQDDISIYQHLSVGVYKQKQIKF